MRRWTFVVFVVGMFVLAWVFGFSVREVLSVEDLSSLEINQRVFLSGEVVSERVIYSGTRLLVLDSGVELVCECGESFLARVVEVEGVVSEYEGKKQVSVLRIVG